MKLEIELGLTQKTNVRNKAVICNECEREVYNLEEMHHLDANKSNRLHSNLAIICPKCNSHIALSRYSIDDISKLKSSGMNNAEIGRLLKISRERVRQLSPKPQPNPDSRMAAIANKSIRTQEEENTLNQYIYEHINTIQNEETERKNVAYRSRKGNNGLLIDASATRRVTDKRTIRKRILNHLVKISKMETEHKRTNQKRP